MNKRIGEIGAAVILALLVLALASSVLRAIIWMWTL